MHKTYKFRLFTNANQERELSQTLETHRRLYNSVLDGKRLCWETAGVDWNFYEQSRWFTVQRGLNPYCARLNVGSARQTLRKLDKAYQAFFRRGGFPRFKSADRFNSFAFDRTVGWKIVNRKLRIQHVGTIRVRWHRDLPTDGKIKTATIKREAGKWFVCFAVELPDPEPTHNTREVGIDVGLKAFVTTSDGEQLGDSRSLENALPELRRRQRALSRCRRGSRRRTAVKRRVTKLYAKVRNTRLDLHHKVARSLVDRYGVIVAESLRVKNMLRNRRLSRRISDAGWSQVIRILCSKAESAGCTVILVDPKNTSQQCSNCGEMVRKSLAVRVHRCSCGCVLDRDVNAAINILARAAPAGVNVSRQAERSPKSQLHLGLK